MDNKKQILENLASPDPQIREQALSELIFLRDPQIIDDVGSLIPQMSDLEKTYVARFFGKLQNPKSINYLFTLLKDPSEKVAKTAGFALDKISSAQKNIEILNLLNSESISLQKYAIATIGRLKLREALPMLCNLLDNGPEILQEDLIKAILAFEEKRTLGAIANKIKSKNEDVQYLVLSAIGSFKDKKYFKKAEECLVSPAEKVRHATIWALGRIDPKKASPLAIELMQNDPSSVVRIEAAKALASSEDIRSIESLLKSYSFDSSQNVRLVTGGILESLKAQVKTSCLLNMLNNPDKKIRMNAISFLFEENNDQVLLKLKHTLEKDNESIVRAKAAEILGSMNEPKVIPWLLNSITDSLDVQYAAVEALGRICTSKDLPILTENIGKTEKSSPVLLQMLLRVLEKIILNEKVSTYPKELKEKIDRLILHDNLNVRYISVAIAALLADPLFLSNLNKLQQEEKDTECQNKLAVAIEKITKHE